MLFADLDLAPLLLQSLRELDYATATPIQAQTIPHAIAGRDVLGSAQTGTGKTAAFALPVLHRLIVAAPAASERDGEARSPRGRRRGRGPRPAASSPAAPIRCLVLCPTRELASQIAESFDDYGRHTRVRRVVLFGGVSQQPQVATLERGAEVCVATPGRLIDLIGQGHVDLSSVDTLVLDEADRMLDMGFIHDIKKIIQRLPERRQTMLFSATVPPAIRTLSRELLRDPVEVSVAPASSTADRVAQSVCHVTRANKTPLLVHYLDALSMSRCVVFTRTKHGADKVQRQLNKAGVASAAIHGNKSQNQRQAALDRFRKGKLLALVATDVAARGIDVDDVSHVVNYDVPRDPESYVHRIGRTARAGAAGAAITFCENDERAFLRDIEALIRESVDVRDDAAGLLQPTPTGPVPPPPKQGGGRPPQPKSRRPVPKGKKPNRQPAPAASRGQGHPAAKPAAPGAAPAKKRRRRRRRGPGDNRPAGSSKA